MMPYLVVEFFAIARERAGSTELRVAPGTLAEVLDAVRRQCPRLGDLVQATGAISPHYRLSLDGRRFLTDVTEVLPAASRLLILSADAGG
jgi:molybdopterin converting factor small subunit